MYRNVEIGKKIEGEKLEKILIEAAEEVGLRVSSVDKYKTRYKLNSVHKEQVYDGSEIKLRGKILPIAEIFGIVKGEARNWFAIGTRFNTMPPYFGFGSEKQIERYLSAVSKRL